MQRRTGVALCCLLWLVLPLGVVQPSSAQTSDPAPWAASATPDGDGDGLPSGDEGRGFRILVAVDIPDSMAGVRDLPVQVVLDMAQILPGEAGYPSRVDEGRTLLQGFKLDTRSLLLWEVDQGGVAIGPKLPVAVLEGSPTSTEPFHPERNPVVTVRWIMPGVTGGDDAEGTRYFYIYFDSTHNDRKPSPLFGRQQTMQLDASVGPGRGTTAFVPLWFSEGANGPSGEPRRARITALHDDTTVSFYEYQNSRPRPEPAQVAEIPGAGQTFEYVLGSNGQQSSEGSVMVKADRPVLVEALSVLQDQRAAGFVASDFIPSADGGFLGRAFTGRPATQEQWQVMCPRVAAEPVPPQGLLGCTFSVNGGGAQNLFANSTRSFNLGAGQPVSLTATYGQVLVQRIGTGLTAWTAADGPRGSSHFLGQATLGDHLLLAAEDDASTCVLAVALAKNKFLTTKAGNRLCLEPGPFHEGTDTWGTTMGRSWEGEDYAPEDAGPLRIEAYAGGSGHTRLAIVSGLLPHGPTNSGSLVVPQSPDGGLTHRIFLPAKDGTPLGSIVLFSLYEGTTGTATRTDGTTLDIRSLGAGERYEIHEPGWWTIRTERPVAGAWLKHGQGAYGAFAPGVVDVAQVEVVSAQFADYAFDLELQGSPFAQAEPGQTVQFTFDVTNLARNVRGEGLGDTVRLELNVPWGDPVVTSGILGAEETQTFTLQVKVPPSASGSGAQLTATLRSGSNEGLVVQQPLHITYVIPRGVEVREESGGSVKVTKHIAQGENANYTVLVTNLGARPDAFQVRFSLPPDTGGNGWIQSVLAAESGQQLSSGTSQDGVLVTTTPLLQAEETARYFVTVTAGPNVAKGDQFKTAISATSLADRSKFDALNLFTAVGVERSFRVLVDSPVRTVEPGTSTTFNVTIKNDSDVDLELAVEVLASLPAGWPAADVLWVEKDAPLAKVNHTISILPHGETTLAVTRAVPAAAAPSSLGLDRLRMQIVGESEAITTDTGLRTLAAIQRGVEASLHAPPHSVIPGTEVTPVLHLQAIGNADQLLRVVPILPGRAWDATNSTGAPPPWSVLLPRDGEVNVTLRLAIPPDAPPGPESVLVGVSLSGAGIATQTVTLPLDVDELRAVDVTVRDVRVDTGRAVEVDVPVENAGNVDLRIDGRWVGLPQGWSAFAETTPLRPGEAGTLHTWIRVPADAPAGLDQAVTLEVAAGGEILSTTEWRLLGSAPRLEATLESIRGLSGDQAAYEVRIMNVGEHAAHNVSVLLDDYRTGTVDRFIINQILPGLTTTAVLLGPADSSHATLRVVADHDPLGLEIIPDGEERRGVPAASLAALLPLLAVLAAAARRRRL